jgi:hypothetical protein
VAFGPQFTNQTDGELDRHLHAPEARHGCSRRNRTPDAEQQLHAVELPDLDRTMGEHHVQGHGALRGRKFKTVFDSAAATQLPFDSQLWYNLGTPGSDGDAETAVYTATGAASPGHGTIE